MAYTANTGFRYFRSISGNMAQPVPIALRIANSTTLRIGDTVRVNTAGFIVGAGTGVVVTGVVVGFTDENQISPFTLGYNTSTRSVTLTGDDQLTTSSTNQTAANYINAEVILDPAGAALWLNKADSALTQTNLFQFFDTDSNNRQITVSTASDTSGTWQLIAIDPNATGGAAADTTMGLFRLVENMLQTNTNSYNSTAIISA